MANDTVAAAAKVQQLQTKLYRAAKSSRSRRFHALFDKLWRNDILERAWSMVASNGGAAGVDGVSITEIEQHGVADFLEELAASLRGGTYRPKPVRRVWIPKADGGRRPLGVPTVADRVVQAAARLVVEPIFEADFADCSFGFRPGRSTHDALEAIRQATNEGRCWVVDADIRSFFDSIDRDKLLAMVAERVSDRRMLKLLGGWLRSGVLEGTTLLDTETGTPQGGVISPLLANIYLSTLDRAFQTAGGRFRLIRYADDFVVCCPSEADALWARELAEDVLGSLGLELHPGKTRVVGLDRGDGFDFLGFHHRLVESHRIKGRRYLQKWPSAQAMKKARGRIRQLTASNMCFLGLDDVVVNLNRFLRGWGNYFRHGNSSRMFGNLDDYVQYRLARFDMKRRGRRRGWQHYGHDWVRRLGVHRLTGTVQRWSGIRPATSAYTAR